MSATMIDETQGLTDEEQEMYQELMRLVEEDGGFSEPTEEEIEEMYQEQIDATTEEVDEDEDGNPVEIAEENTSEDSAPQALTGVHTPNTLEANRGFSTIEKPVRFVHALADAMPGCTRKQVVDAAVAAGVNIYTARTQYQIWFKAQRTSTGPIPHVIEEG